MVNTIMQRGPRVAVTIAKRDALDIHVMKREP